MQNTDSKRLLYLDSARGLAALSVVTWHFLLAVYTQQFDGFHYRSFLRFFWYGEANVIFFFIHSGFILAYSYAGEGKKLSVRYYLRFLIERVFRIYPLFLVILFLSFIAITNTPYLQHQGPETWVGDFWSFPMTFYQTLEQAILVIRIPEAAGLRLIPQDWTLTVELLAGATVPLLAFAGKRHLLLFVALLAVLKLGNFFTTYVFEFGLGVFLFLIRDNITAVWKKLPMVIKILIAVAAVFFYTGFFVFPALYSQEIELVNGVVDRVIVAAGCMLFFVMLLSSAKLQKILSMPFLVTVGKICYSIYLVHKLLLMIWWRSFEEFFNSISSRGPLAVLSFYIVYISLVLALSYMFFKLVEKPANLLGKKISKSLARKER